MAGTDEAERVTVVIGGGGGIGSEVARHLDGTVVVAGRTRESLEAVADQTGASVRELDARDLGAVATTLEGVAEEHVDGGLGRVRTR